MMQPVESQFILEQTLLTVSQQIFINNVSMLGYGGHKYQGMNSAQIPVEELCRSGKRLLSL